MTTPRPDRLLRRVVLGVGVACVTVVGATALVMAVPSFRLQFADLPIEKSGYAVGDTVDVSPDLYANSPSTLLFFALNHCGACQNSRPVLTDVVSAVRGAQVPVAMVTGLGQPQSQDDFARGVGLTASSVHRADLPRLHLRGVPTVLVVNQRGVVLFTHEGTLTAADGAAAIAAALHPRHDRP